MTMYLQRVSLCYCNFKEGIILATKKLNIRIEEELKQQSEELFEDLGLTLSTAIKMFLKQSVRECAIPFEIKINKESEQAFREVENNELETVHSLDKLWENLNAD